MQQANSHPRLTPLIIAGVISWLLYAAFAWYSRDFGPATPGIDRPILPALAILGLAFAVYLMAIRLAIRANGHRELVPAIFVFALGFRATLLFTEPFQEVDIYRYIWDGHVSKAGVNPFRSSPREVIAADSGETTPAELRKLVALRDSDPTLKAILKRVHFGHLRTVYPATSQAVFAAAAWSTPNGAGVRTHLVVMKGWLLAFDVGVLWLVILLLRLFDKPVGWAVAYGWCPLVLKEFANSGHLDSIAVFFTVLAVWMLLKAVPRDASFGMKPAVWFHLAAVAVSLAIGAKLYPIVLAPLMAITAIRRIGWWRSCSATLLAAGLTGGLMWPMLAASRGQSHQDLVAKPTIPVVRPPVPTGGTPLPPAHIVSAAAGKKNDNSGLKTFLSSFKMNDFLFMLLAENLTPTADVPPERRPWFVITSENWRRSITHSVGRHLPTGNVKSDAPTSKDIAFLIARGITLLLFAGLMLTWSIRGTRELSRDEILRAVFFTLAWFWLLSPTLNPWYWTWALPFLPFARGRAWLAVSGLVLLYYLRFWFRYHYGDSTVAFTHYRGVDFHDYIVVWLEFAPWFVWLAIDSWRRRKEPL